MTNCSDITNNKLVNLVDTFVGDNGFYAKNLTKNEVLYEKNTDKCFVSASIIKVPIMVYAIKKIFDGSLNLKALHRVSYEGMIDENQNLNEDQNHMIMFDIIKRMITHSDNACTNYLIELFTMDKLNNYFKTIGLKNTRLERKMLDYEKINQGLNNYTSIEDMVYIFKQIYKKQLLGETQSKIMLAILSEQQDRTKIAKILKSGMVYAGKTGELDNIRHDIGLVFTKNSDYLIAGFIQNVCDEDEATTSISTFSSSIMDMTI